MGAQDRDKGAFGRRPQTCLTHNWPEEQLTRAGIGVWYTRQKKALRSDSIRD